MPIIHSLALSEPAARLSPNLPIAPLILAIIIGRFLLKSRESIWTISFLGAFGAVIADMLVDGQAAFLYLIYTPLIYFIAVVGRKNFLPAPNPLHARRTRQMNLISFFAFLCAAFAYLKSGQYHAQGQLTDDRIAILLFISLSCGCILTNFTRICFARPSRETIVWFTVATVASIFLLIDALRRFHTAVLGEKDHLW